MLCSLALTGCSQEDKELMGQNFFGVTESVDDVLNSLQSNRQDMMLDDFNIKEVEQTELTELPNMLLVAPEIVQENSSTTSGVITDISDDEVVSTDSPVILLTLMNTKDGISGFDLSSDEYIGQIKTPKYKYEDTEGESLPVTLSTKVYVKLHLEQAWESYTKTGAKTKKDIAYAKWAQDNLNKGIFVFKDPGSTMLNVNGTQIYEDTILTSIEDLTFTSLTKEGYKVLRTTQVAPGVGIVEKIELGNTTKPALHVVLDIKEAKDTNTGISLEVPEDIRTSHKEELAKFIDSITKETGLSVDDSTDSSGVVAAKTVVQNYTKAKTIVINIGYNNATDMEMLNSADIQAKICSGLTKAIMEMIPYNK